jgi:L-arabinokinase
MAGMIPDRLQLENHVARLLAQLSQQGRPLFSGEEPPVVARAPGRLDVMGGIGDYSGCLVLELPLAVAAFVCVQKTAAPHVRVVSAGFGHDAPPVRDVSLPIAELQQACSSYAEARAYFAASGERAWVAYVAGALAALRLELGVEPRGGLDILVCSSVPEGKGVSSSAAVEVASFRALAGLAGAHVDPVQGALICQRIENLVVGAPCGVMDQMTSSLGSEGQLLALSCQPARLEGNCRVPDGLRFWGVDSLLAHQVSGASYTEVRVAAFMGYTIIARLLGLPIQRGPQPGKVVIDDGLFGGYLANVGVPEFKRELAARLPERLSGAAFLQGFDGIVDPVTQISPDAVYRVRAATAHPIYEHARAHEFRVIMEHGAGPGAWARLGDLMYQAHDSYGACGLGSPGTDRLVRLVREAGPARGLYGAKITGGGSGGTVAVLGTSDGEDALREVAETYAREVGGSPHVLFGSSAGAVEFGLARLVLDGSSVRLEQVERVASSVDAQPVESA